MNDDILSIIPPSFPYDLDAKIFCFHDEEGNPIGEPYSYNDKLKALKDISGINNELLGEPE